MSTTIVQSKGLSLWYGSFQALYDVDFDIERGEILALIGPSGCGKSTLLRCLNRMNDAPTTRTTGRLEVDGVDVNSAATNVLALRRDVGMVFQRPNPLPLSVRENVLFGVRLHSALKDRDTRDQLVQDALTDVGMWDALKDRLDQPAESLSLERRQKLCIARLLPLKPKILLMDEPCSALDPEGIRAVEDLMARLKGRYTQVIVTHNMQQARRVSDRCIYMYMGRLIEVGPTATLFTNPRETATAQYIEGRFG